MPLLQALVAYWFLVHGTRTKADLKRGKQHCPRTAAHNAPQLTQPASTNDCRQFFLAFNEYVNKRILDETSRHTQVSTDMKDILCVSLSDILRDDGGQHQQMFVERFIANGGSALIKLSKKDATIISKMWSLTKILFEKIDHPSTAGEQISLSENVPKTIDLRYQKLPGDKQATKKDVGYHYVEIGHGDQEMLQTIGKIVGDPSISNAAIDSLDLLFNIGEKVASMVISRLSETDLETSETLVDCLLGSTKEKSTLTSFQRLARYMQADPEQTETENLGSHCDWSIFTIIPVSDEPGLQVFDTQEKRWLSPEVAIQNHCERSVRISDQELDIDRNDSFVVLMAGKWFELLTGGKAESCIHRVISPRDTPRRFSAPFFLRLQLPILEAIESIVLEHPTDIESSRRAMMKHMWALRHASTVVPLGTKKPRI